MFELKKQEKNTFTFVAKATKEELEKFRKANPNKKYLVNRLKGLGEMSVEETEETLTDPENRIIKQINVEDAKVADAQREPFWPALTNSSPKLSAGSISVSSRSEACNVGILSIPAHAASRRQAFRKRSVAAEVIKYNSSSVISLSLRGFPSRNRRYSTAWKPVRFWPVAITSSRNVLGSIIFIGCRMVFCHIFVECSTVEWPSVNVWVDAII